MLGFPVRHQFLEPTQTHVHQVGGAIQPSLILCRPLLLLPSSPRPFRYDLNQIPYDYTVEVTNRFKGLDLKDRVPEELWMEFHNIVQEVVIKTIPKKKKGKMVV